MKLKLCRICGNKITNRNNYFCSIECKKQSYKRRLYENGKSKGYSLGLLKGKCKNCNNEFPKRGSSHLFCCYDCRYESMVMKDKKPCKICGEKLGKRKRYYCDECRKTFKRKNIVINPKPCKICKKEFKGKNNRQLYCSQECKDEVDKIRYETKYKNKYEKRFIKKSIQCKTCNENFMKRTPNNIFCSIKCRKKYYDNIQNFTLINDNRFHKSLKLRFEILKRDNFTCQYCGRNPKQDKCKLQVDHIIPRSKGGEDIPSNLQASCFECNQGKKDIILENRKLPKLNIINVEIKDEII